MLQSFIEKVLGGPSGILISIAVAMSCMGTVNGSMSSDTRYTILHDLRKLHPKHTWF